MIGRKREKQLMDQIKYRETRKNCGQSLTTPCTANIERDRQTYSKPSVECFELTESQREPAREIERETKRKTERERERAHVIV